MLYRGEGCKACKKSGYAGRMGIFEILVITDDIRELVLKKAVPMTLRERAVQTQDIKSLREDAVSKVLAGFTTVEEVNRVTFADLET